MSNLAEMILAPVRAKLDGKVASSSDDLVYSLSEQFHHTAQAFEAISAIADRFEALNADPNIDPSVVNVQLAHWGPVLVSMNTAIKGDLSRLGLCLAED